MRHPVGLHVRTRSGSFQSSRKISSKLRRSGIGNALLEQVGHRVLPAGADFLFGEVARGGVEIVRLEVAEHLDCRARKIV